MHERDATLAHVLDSTISVSGSPGEIPVSTFSTPNFEFYTDSRCMCRGLYYQVRSESRPSSSAALPGVIAAPPHIPPTCARLSAFSTLHGPVNMIQCWLELFL